MQYSKKQYLMGTNIEIVVLSNNNALGDIYNCFGIFHSLEIEFSRFQKESDLSLLNYDKEHIVSDRFVDVLNLSKQIYNESEGFFNPLINLNKVGYSSDFMKGDFKLVDFEHNIDFEKVVILGNHVSLKKNQSLDLGGIVKGYAVDLASSYLKEKGYKDFIVNAGGDIFISGNNKSGNIPVVAIDSPFNNGEIFATIELKNKAISTSGTYKRKWNINDEKFHHILNPETNTNNNEIISISLIASKCYIADSYATACVAMGIDKSLAFLEKHGIDGLIIGSDGNLYTTKGMKDYNLEII